MPNNDDPDLIKKLEIRDASMHFNRGNNNDDNLLIEMLEGMGLDLTQHRELNVCLVFPAETGAKAAESDLRKLGFATEVAEIPRPFLARLFQKPQWVLSGTTQSPTDTFAIAAHRRDLEAIAAAHGGEYDGWEVGVAENGIASDGTDSRAD